MSNIINMGELMKEDDKKRMCTLNLYANKECELSLSVIVTSKLCCQRLTVLTET